MLGKHLQVEFFLHLPCNGLSRETKRFVDLSCPTAFIDDGKHLRQIGLPNRVSDLSYYSLWIDPAALCFSLVSMISNETLIETVRR